MAEVTIDEVPAEADEFMSRAEFTRLAGIAPRTAAHWAKRGFGPRPTAISPRKAVYDRREALAFLRSGAAA